MYDLYYARNIYSLLVCISLAKKNKRKKILVINNGIMDGKKVLDLNHRILDKIKNYLKKEFEYIYYFKASLDLKEKNIFFRYIERSKKIKTFRRSKIFTNLKKFKIENIYSSNDDFDSSLYPFFKKKKFHYIEHGIGNFINSIESSNKRNLYYNLLRFAYFCSLSSFYPIKFSRYFSLLKNNRYEFQYVNGFKTKSFGLKNFSSTVEFLSKKINLNKPGNYKNNIFINLSNFENDTPKKVINSAIKKVIKISKHNKYNFIIKDHTRRKAHKVNKKIVLSLLKKEKINVLKVANFLPAELVAKFYKCKKLISLQSSLPYHYSKIDKKCEISIFFDLSMKYHSKNTWFVGKVNLYNLRWYKKNFKNINFI